MPLWAYAIMLVFVAMLAWPSTGGRLVTWWSRRRRRATSRRSARRDAKAFSRAARPAAGTCPPPDRRPDAE